MNPHRAHALVGAAIARGELRAATACPCVACGVVGDTNIHHHADYSRPLDVMVLCRACHRAVHGGRRAEPTTPRRRLAATILAALRVPNDEADTWRLRLLDSEAA